MFDYRVLLRALAGFPGDLVTAVGVGDMLQRLADAVTDVLDLAGAGVLVGAGERLAFVTAVPEEVAALERSQEEEQRGPCIMAYRTGEAVLVPDLRVWPESWSGYREVAERVGIRAVAGVPMRVGDVRLGALNLYSTAHREWEAEDVEAAQAMANVAAAYYSMEMAMRAKEDLAEQLQRALDSRVVIEQAKGVIAEATGVSPGAAFERMRRWARGHNQPLHAVARRVIEDHLRP